jgi:predicted dehydrogenase
VNVIWDLAVHDISIIQYILGEKPAAVSATGANQVAGTPENMAHLALFFQSSCIAHVTVNWLSPVKVRRTLIGGSRKMIVYDDVEATDKVKVYDKGITISGAAENAHQLRIGYRAGGYVGTASARHGSSESGSGALHRLPLKRHVCHLEWHDRPSGGRDSGGGVPFHWRAR